MNLTLLDWSIVAALFAAVAAVAVYTRRYSRSVADFLAGSRCAGRYLFTLSEGIAGLGLVGAVANFEKFYKGGFAAAWWGTLLAPVGLVIALSGWVSYRYRETRAMTMAQFFEMRYSRRFRIFAGVVAWGSGVLNFGIFPGIVARFIVYFCGLPPTLAVAGFAVPTIAPVMAFMLGATLVLILSGGMVTVMITDFLQAQFINIVFLAIAGALFARFRVGGTSSPRWPRARRDSRCSIPLTRAECRTSTCGSSPSSPSSSFTTGWAGRGLKASTAPLKARTRRAWRACWPSGAAGSAT